MTGYLDNTTGLFFNMTVNSVLLTIDTASLSGVVNVESGKASWGVDVQVDRLSQLQQGDVVGTCEGALVALVDDRIHRQGDNFPDNNQVF